MTLRLKSVLLVVFLAVVTLLIAGMYHELIASTTAQQNSILSAMTIEISPNLNSDLFSGNALGYPSQQANPYPYPSLYISSKRIDESSFPRLPILADPLPYH